MQATFQRYVDHSISKTLNLRPGTSFEEYKNLFMYGYERGLKGFTTFNPDGSMRGILEYADQKERGIRRRSRRRARRTCLRDTPLSARGRATSRSSSACSTARCTRSS
jgi:ribonucleotide reductase alpha subunit